MVQILPKVQGFGEKLGASIGGGFSKGFGQASEFAMKMKMEDAKLKRRMELIDKARNSSKGSPGMEESPTSELASPSYEELSERFLKIVPEIEEQEGRELTPKDLDNIWSQMSQVQESQPQQQQQEQRRQQQDPFAEAEAMAEIGEHDLARVASDKAKSAQKSQQFAHSSTQKYADELRESAANAEEIKFASGVMRNVLRSGKTGPTAQNMAYAYLTDIKSPMAGMFQSKEAGKFNVAMKTLASGFKKIMGAKPTEREFFWYENILPGLLKAAPTNEAILDYFEHLADLDIKSQEIADKIVEGNGGMRPIDLDSKVRKQMKPFLNEAINEGYSLSGEFEAEPKKGKSKSPEKTIFTDLPPANRTNQGKILTNEDTGEKFKSNGKEWVPLNG